jgi:hypothetical protein
MGLWMIDPVMGSKLLLATVALAGLPGAAAVVAGAGASSQANNCAANVGPGVVQGGGYTTRCLLPGMRLIVPAGGWVSEHDSPIEFTLSPPHTAYSDPTPIHFWIDPHASTPCTDDFVSADLSTPAKIVGWLKHDKNLIISGPRRSTLAGHIAALSVNLNVTAKAPRCSSSCPGPCIDYFLFKAPNFHSDVFGTGRGEFVRLWFAQIGPPRHLLMAGTDALTKARFATLNAAMSRILASLRLPPKLPSRQGR